MINIEIIIMKLYKVIFMFELYYQSKFLNGTLHRLHVLYIQYISYSFFFSFFLNEKNSLTILDLQINRFKYKIFNSEGTEKVNYKSAVIFGQHRSRIKKNMFTNNACNFVQS